jgi:hypothetical protein
MASATCDVTNPPLMSKLLLGGVHLNPTSVWVCCYNRSAGSVERSSADDAPDPALATARPGPIGQNRTRATDSRSRCRPDRPRRESVGSAQRRLAFLRLTIMTIMTITSAMGTTINYQGPVEWTAAGTAWRCCRRQVVAGQDSHPSSTGHPTNRATKD